MRRFKLRMRWELGFLEKVYENALAHELTKERDCESISSGQLTFTTTDRRRRCIRCRFDRGRLRAGRIKSSKSLGRCSSGSVHQPSARHRIPHRLTDQLRHPKNRNQTNRKSPLARSHPISHTSDLCSSAFIRVHLSSLDPNFNPRTCMSDPYITIIGLEVHVQLLTESKLFCGCSTKFGAPPNTQTCPVCIGMPGTLPVMNREAFELGLKTAVALNCKIAPFTKWDRKNYYYPDLPKGYQISQYDLPFSSDGYLEISDPKGRFEPKKIGIIRAHLEEDAGKSMHDEAAGKADSRIDLNRTGTPLLEIVSEPDMRSPLEAKAYLDRVEAAAHVPRRLRLQHAGRKLARRCQRESAHSAARRPRWRKRRSSKSKT